MTIKALGSSHTLVPTKTTKPKLLVVDDEQDNRELLYRTFRRDFQVFQAESGHEALAVLRQEGEVAVIISDQRMPEMKGTEFLRQTVPVFPDTMRMILTGFTDVEDLIDAINSGQVCQYLTKPWDPEQLRDVVIKASETYALQKQRISELRRSQLQKQLQSKFIEVSQRSADWEAALQTIAESFSSSFNGDFCDFIVIDDGQTNDISGSFSRLGIPFGYAITETPLVIRAIESTSSQFCGDVVDDPDLGQFAGYQEHQIKQHLVTVVKFQQASLGILSLQWQTQGAINLEDALVINQCTEEMALSLALIHRSSNWQD
jgi:CheY-like chemotaxis protein